MGAIDFNFGDEPSEHRHLRYRLRAAQRLNNDGDRIEFVRELMGPLRTEVFVRCMHINADVDRTDLKRWLAEDIN